MKVYVETYGCQMNLSDSEIVAGLLAGEGMEIVAEPAAAEAILINTCAVRENAERRIRRRLRELAPRKRAGRAVRIGLLGCLAQSLKKDLLAAGGVDFIVGPDAYRSLPALLRAENGARQATTLSKSETYTDIAPLRRSAANGWVTVMRGCDNFCSFCVVPFARGRERSRAFAVIVAEVERLAAEGFRQVTLLGQNVNSYRHEGRRFADVMRAACRVEGIARVRFISPHPKDFPGALLDVLAGERCAMPHVHLPLQSGSDAVLARMNRGYTFDRYRELVGRLRDAVPGVAITTDLIAGFPGETEEEFDATVRAMEEIRFHSAFTFAYSERRNTAAARRYADDVPPEKKARRVERLVALEREHARQRLEEEVGREIEVLVERPSRKSPAEAFGRTPRGSGVVFPAARIAPGALVSVRIDEATTHTLLGHAAGEEV